MANPFYIKKNGIYAVPIIHYNMEMAAQVKLAFDTLKPDCVAVELPETMTLQFLHAASRLPDISIVLTEDCLQAPLYFMCEPCDGAFEGLRSSLEAKIPCYCIDLDREDYPPIRETLPDPYAIQRIGLEEYYSIYLKAEHRVNKKPFLQDTERELYMARRLKELSFSYDRILFVSGMAHVKRVLESLDRPQFPDFTPPERSNARLCTLTEKSCREGLAEFGWMTTHYEAYRSDPHTSLFPPDRQKMIYDLYKCASDKYVKATGNSFPGYHFRNLMKFVRNLAHLYSMLMPDLFQILTAAKGCVDHNFAYETWLLATEYPHLRNIDGLEALDLTVEQLWGKSKIIRFYPKQQTKKSLSFNTKRKDRSQVKFKPPGPFSICSYQPEDLVIENFGKFLQKKGTQLLSEEGARTIPFSSSLEDGVDTKETIRHWYEKKLYVKTAGRPPGGVGSVVVIFDQDEPEEGKTFKEKYPWKTTWIGEHQQESDMAFYATSVTDKVVGPGISRCEYGGFMMSYPPRRLFDVWTDPDYQGCRNKSEVLLVSAIDYALRPLIVYVANKPPRTAIKSLAKRFGKKIVYIPIGQLSPVTLNKLRVFHVLDGHDKRSIADEYIY